MRSALLMVSSSIFVLGLIMIFSTTSAEVLDLDLDKSTHQALIRQIFNLFAGIILAGIVLKLGYQRFLKASPIFLFFFCLLLLLVLIPGIGTKVNGSRRWLSLAGFSIQPSEFVKYVVPAFFIHHVLKYDVSFLTFKQFGQFVAICALPIALIIIEPNNGTAIVIGINLVVLFFLTRIPLKYWAVPLAVFTLAGGIFASQLPYVSARLKVYLDPELDLKGKGHQPYQAKIAAGSGQLFGKGPGNSLQKLSYLPEAQNDYIAAIYAEEFGFLGILLLISLYAYMGLMGFIIAQRSKNLGAFYLAASISFLFCFQAFLNMGVVSGLLPSTGLNLPLFSQGGTSLIANVMGIGFLLSVANENEEIRV
jgi:cell division protein FtsW